MSPLNVDVAELPIAGDRSQSCSRARYYDATVGRWTSEDPIGFAAGDGNLVRYVGNDTVNSRDPTGLDSGIGEAVIKTLGGSDVRFAFAVGDQMAQTESGRNSMLRNAGRHIAWTAVMTVFHGEDYAEKWARWHEKGAGDNETDLQDSRRDEVHNEIGLRIGRELRDEYLRERSGLPPALVLDTPQIAIELRNRWYTQIRHHVRSAIQRGEYVSDFAQLDTLEGRYGLTDRASERLRRLRGLEAMRERMARIRLETRYRLINALMH